MADAPNGPRVQTASTPVLDTFNFWRTTYLVVGIVLSDYRDATPRAAYHRASTTRLRKMTFQMTMLETVLAAGVSALNLYKVAYQGREMVKSYRIPSNSRETRHSARCVQGLRTRRGTTFDLGCGKILRTC